MHVVNTLAPVFLVILVGAGLRRYGFLDAVVQHGITRLSYWVGLPALLFLKIASAPELSEAGMSLAIVLLATCGLMAISLMTALAIRLNARQVGTFLQASFRGNLAYVGLPVIVYAFADAPDSVTADRVIGVAALVMGPTIVLYNVVAVIGLLLSEHRFDRRGLRRIVRQVATNPLLLACIAGASVGQLGVDLPVLLVRTLDTLGQVALPVALLSIGGTLATTRLQSRLGLALITSLLKTAVGPALGVVVAIALGAGPEQTAIAVLLLGCPTAIASYVLTQQLNGDSPLAASSIVVSTVLSAIGLAVILAML